MKPPNVPHEGPARSGGPLDAVVGLTCEICGAPTGWVEGWKLQSAHEAKRAAMGTGRVLAELLRDATAVLRTIDPEDASEGELLEALINRAEKAYGEILTPNGGGKRSDD